MMPFTVYKYLVTLYDIVIRVHAKDRSLVYASCGPAIIRWQDLINPCYAEFIFRKHENMFAFSVISVFGKNRIQ